jgi:hypothetical protein
MAERRDRDRDRQQQQRVGDDDAAGDPAQFGEQDRARLDRRRQQQIEVARFVERVLAAQQRLRGHESHHQRRGRQRRGIGHYPSDDRNAAQAERDRDSDRHPGGEQDVGDRPAAGATPRRSEAEPQLVRDQPGKAARPQVTHDEAHCGARVSSMNASSSVI